MYVQAKKWLQEILGNQAAFREGQWEAIEALVANRQRVLVVQRTGWGKSLVYFMATRLLRESGTGPTLLISPLLSLMRNQIHGAKQWGLRAATLNSTNFDDHGKVEAALLAGQIDILLISPERLANDAFQERVWPRLKNQIGLLVIDEVHCISDWGHDFRPNYRRIMYLLDDLRPSTPVLGTTATANNRVVADAAEIMGAGINIQRGSLTRDSLQLYVYPEPMTHATRLTLLTHLLHSLPGSGIIYCTTTRDCKIVAEWLQIQGFPVKPYFADVEEALNEDRETLEEQLLNNEVKALVSSVALGMGFDKSDLHFVIHYQQPGNIISYYQQIGRAGRGIDRAHIVLMHGIGDDDIQHYFIENAFPAPQQVEAVTAALADGSMMSRSELQRQVNARQSVLEKILTHLETERIIGKNGSNYVLLKANISPDYNRWHAVTQNRYIELEQMKAYIQHKGCLMRFIAEALDDPCPVERCGRCKNCRANQSKFAPDIQEIAAAEQFLRRGRPILLDPRKRWPSGFPGARKTTITHLNRVGIALCGYYDAGWGEVVKTGRFLNNYYSDKLIEAAAELLLQHWEIFTSPPTWITAVPSLRRPRLVPDFAERLAQRLNLPYYQAVKHVTQHPEQRKMHNSYQQAVNVYEKFTATGKIPAEPVLLVDDVADTRWTLTVIGSLLQQQGCTAVTPFVLAATNIN